MEIKRLKNREYAQTCRENKKEADERKEREYQQLKVDNKILKEELDALTARFKNLLSNVEVLQFQGYVHEGIKDMAGEISHIKPVLINYYLLDDTMEVIELRTVNSGHIQVPLFGRQVYTHPKGKGRRYLWKDMNLGQDIRVYGITIRLADCDLFTKEYLINAGIELHDSEEIPLDSHMEQRKAMQPKNETIAQSLSFKDKNLYKFKKLDKEVLRFYGMWHDIASDTPEMHKVILQFYLSDDTMDVLKDQAVNSSRDSSKVIIERQKIPVNVNTKKSLETFPSNYMEIKDEDLEWLQPSDFKTGKDILVFGKKIFLYDCDNFTRHYYQTQLGVELNQIAITHKTKVIPPHTGIGAWDNTLQTCSSFIPKPAKKDFIKELNFNQVVLKFKARLISPMQDKHGQYYVVSYYPSDDSVAIHKESSKPGFPGRRFYKKDVLLKEQQYLTDPITFYKADDFYVGAHIRASGKTFLLTDADP